MPTQTHQLDVDNSAVATNIVGWCYDNLDDSRWSIELLGLSPSRFKFKFESDQDLLLAVLNS